MSEVFPRIFNLRFQNNYTIIDFGKLDNNKYFILAIEKGSNTITDHYYYYYINKQCYDVLNKYFIIIGGKIMCGYNGKIYNDISLLLCIRDKGQQTLTLKLNNNLSFTFCINCYTEFDLSRQRPYIFDCILIVNKNLILGNEGVIYHNITYYKDYILENLDKSIKDKIINAKDSETLNIYTHILNRSRKCKLEINNSMEAMRSNKHITKVPFSTNNSNSTNSQMSNKLNKFDISKLSLSTDIFKYNKYPKSK